MKLFDVYPLYDVNPVRAQGCYVYDEKGKEYLDLYGGHGVISIGHSHKGYVDAVSDQLGKIGFYSNSIQNELQIELAEKLGELSNLNQYDLFLCNSGAEANENALKLASFHTNKSKVLSFNKAFHGRTSASVSVTDNPGIKAPINSENKVEFLEINNKKALIESISQGDVAAVIIEGIQGVGGLDEASTEFFKLLEEQCKKHQVILILDEIQSGFGRTGDFFAFQKHDIQPDIVTVAKGMGNGFPVAGVLISKKIQASYGLLGTTFGGNHLACAAGIAVLNTIEKEALLDHVKQVSSHFVNKAKNVEAVEEIKGRGLMLGLRFGFKVAELRKKLIFEEGIFTGGSSDPNLLRILPPLNVTEAQLNQFLIALEKVLKNLDEATENQRKY